MVMEVFIFDTHCVFAVGTIKWCFLAQVFRNGFGKIPTHKYSFTNTEHGSAFRTFNCIKLSHIISYFA